MSRLIFNFVLKYVFLSVSWVILYSYFMPPSTYGVIVYFCYLMSHRTIVQAIFFSIDWHYTTTWFPALLLRLSTCAYGPTMVKMRHGLAHLYSNIITSLYMVRNIKCGQGSNFCPSVRHSIRTFVNFCHN